MGKNYIFVILVKYSRYTWVFFLTYKNEAFETFNRLWKRITIEKNALIMAIKSDRGREFIYEALYWDTKGIKCQLYALRTPQQNRVVDQSLPHKFWAETINTSCYICIRCLLRPLLGKITYKLYYDKNPFNLPLQGVRL